MYPTINTETKIIKISTQLTEIIIATKAEITATAKLEYNESIDGLGFFIYANLQREIE